MYRPQLLAQPDAIHSTLESHNSWVVDGVTDYIDWSVKQGFGIMDVNVPAYLAQDDDTDPFTPRSSEKELQEQIKSLVGYLWDNYIQLFKTKEIVLMGVGNAYLGVKVLLVSRGKSHSRPLLFSFVSLFRPTMALLTASRMYGPHSGRPQLCHRSPPPRQVRRRRGAVGLVQDALARLRGPGPRLLVGPGPHA